MCDLCTASIPPELTAALYEYSATGCDGNSCVHCRHCGAHFISIIVPTEHSTFWWVCKTWLFFHSLFRLWHPFSKRHRVKLTGS
jgi:hypothetical protein